MLNICFKQKAPLENFGESLLYQVIYGRTASMTLCVSLGSCDKVSRAAGLIHKIILFFTVLEAGSLRSGCQLCLVLERALPSLQKALFHSILPHVVQQRGRKEQDFFLQGHWSHHGGPTLRTSSGLNYILKAPPPNTIILGARASTRGFKENMQHSFLCYL